MGDIFRFFNHKLFLFITFLLVSAMAAMYFTTEYVMHIAMENSIQADLQKIYTNVENDFQREFETLEKTSKDLIPSLLDLLATHGNESIQIPESDLVNLMILFSDVGEKISERTPIADDDFFTSLYKEVLQTFPKESESKNIFSTNKYFALYTMTAIKTDNFRGWLLLGNLYPPKLLASLEKVKNIRYSFIHYQSRIPNSPWQIIENTTIPNEKREIWTTLGSVSQKSPFLKYTSQVNKQRFILYPQPLLKDIERANLGILLEQDIPSIHNLFLVGLENYIWIFLIATILVIFGTIYFTKKSRSEIIQATEVLNEFALNGSTSTISLESIEIPELQNGISELVRFMDKNSQSTTEQTNQLQEKNYELERANFELRLMVKIAQVTNFQSEPFDILSLITEALMEHFHSQAAYFYTREADGNPLVFSKRRIHSTKQILSMKDFLSLNKTFGDTFIRSAREESERAIATQKVQKTELASEKDQKFYQIVNIPISLPNQSFGSLCIILGAEEYFFTEKDQEILDKIATETNSILSFSKKKNTNYLDSSTNLYNFRYFEQQVTNEILRAQRNNSILSLLIVELDDYSKFSQNTEYQNIESLVKDLATVIRSVCRTTDIIARKEAATYFLLLPETPPEGATMVAEKIRNAVDKTNFNLEGKMVHLTVSLGAAIYPTQAVLPRDLIKLATTALDSARSLGGNRSSVLRLQGGTIS